MANFFQRLIKGIKTNFSLILKGILSGVLLMLGPLLARLVRLGNANMGIIITIGLISEAIGLGAFWLVIRKEYRIGEETEEKEENTLQKLRSRIFHSKSENTDE